MKILYVLSSGKNTKWLEERERKKILNDQSNSPVIPVTINKLHKGSIIGLNGQIAELIAEGLALYHSAIIKELDPCRDGNLGHKDMIESILNHNPLAKAALRNGEKGWRNIKPLIKEQFLKRLFTNKVKPAVWRIFNKLEKNDQCLTVLSFPIVEIIFGHFSKKKEFQIFNYLSGFKLIQADDGKVTADFL